MKKNNKNNKKNNKKILNKFFNFPEESYNIIEEENKLNFTSLLSEISKNEFQNILKKIEHNLLNIENSYEFNDNDSLCEKITISDHPFQINYNKASFIFEKKIKKKFS